MQILLRCQSGDTRERYGEHRCGARLMQPPHTLTPCIKHKKGKHDKQVPEVRH